MEIDNEGFRLSLHGQKYDSRKEQGRSRLTHFIKGVLRESRVGGIVTNVAFK